MFRPIRGHIWLCLSRFVLLPQSNAPFRNRLKTLFDLLLAQFFLGRFFKREEILFANSSDTILAISLIFHSKTNIVEYDDSFLMDVYFSMTGDGSGIAEGGDFYH